MSNTRWKSALDTAEALAIIAASGAVVFTLTIGRSLSPSARGGPATAPAPEDVSSQNLSVSVSTASSMGDDGARIAVIEFADFQCPFCARHALETLPRLRADFINNGKIRYFFKHFPIAQMHAFANPAAKQAMCAGKQSQFWPMHDRLFEGSSRLSQEFLATGPVELKLNIDAFFKCLETIGGELGADIADARRLRVTSTPTFFVGRISKNDSVAISTRLSGAYPYETFAATIAALDKKTVSQVKRW